MSALIKSVDRSVKTAMPDQTIICNTLSTRSKMNATEKISGFKCRLPAEKMFQWSVNTWLKSGLLLLIRMYQLIISPVMHPSCRFYPTCSVYAYQSIERHGLLKGGTLAVKRLLKCHPFGGSGYDPVP